MEDIKGKKELRCDPDQYAMLKRCSNKRDLTEWNDWRKKNPDSEVWLQGADFERFFLESVNFKKAHCEGAKFVQAICVGADFMFAHCEGAKFVFAHCEGAEFAFAHSNLANFVMAHCERANFHSAHCEEAYFGSAYCGGAAFREANLYSAVFSGAFLSEKTCFLKCKIDADTDFSYVNLSGAMMEPGTKAKLEQNIRRKHWQGWGPLYKRATLKRLVKTPWYALLRKLPTIPRKSTKLIAALCLVPVLLVRFFWYISDYEYSTTRILRWFFIFIIMFTVLYTLFPSMLAFSFNNRVLNPQGFFGYVAHFFQMFAFATSTMVTLGFSNINVAMPNGQPHFGGMLAVTTNLMVGYFMLAVLVTRLAILFQTLGPGYIVPPAKKKDDGS